jgi:hypothetical protein
MAAPKPAQDAPPPASAPNDGPGAARTVQVAIAATEAEATELRLAAAIEGGARGPWLLGVGLREARRVIAAHMERRAAEAADDGA